MVIYCLHFISNCYTVYLYITVPEKLDEELEDGTFGTFASHNEKDPESNVNSEKKISKPEVRIHLIKFQIFIFISYEIF